MFKITYTLSDIKSTKITDITSATASSIWHEEVGDLEQQDLMKPANAIDGDNYTYAMTNENANEWVKVTLGKTYYVTIVTVVNRFNHVDGNTLRLNGAIVSLTTSMLNVRLVSF